MRFPSGIALTHSTRFGRLLLTTLAFGAFLLVSGTVVLAQAPGTSNDELARRLDALERATHEQIDALRKELDARKTELADERARRVELEKRIADLSSSTVAASPPAQPGTAPTAPQVAARTDERNAGAEARTEVPDPLAELVKSGRDLQGNVYSGEQFKVRLGGSLRSSFQWNSTPVGDSVSKALLPDPTIPGGGDNTGRESFRALAGFSRLLLAIQGPTTLGGKTLGYVEIDFARNLSGGEGGAVTPNPRLRHAYLRWAFDNVGKEGAFLQLTMGQTGGYLDLTPDTVDFNTFTGGLGASYRRNPKIAIIYGMPLGDAGRLVFGSSLERPILGSDTVGGDLGNGDVSSIPVFTVGAGYETTRRLSMGDEFGIGSLKFGARFGWGQFEERFQAGTIIPDFDLQTGFDEQQFSAGAIHGGLSIDGLGFNAEGRAHTFSIKASGLWTKGDAGFIDAGFDRRVVLNNDGSLEPAHSAGGFVNPIFYLSDNVSLRWAGGAQWALDPNFPAVTGSLNNGYYRIRNWQNETSIWWTPGPFTFALGYNFTHTNFRNIDPFTRASFDLANSNQKIEAIGWFSF